MQIDVVLQEAGSDLDFSCFHSMRSQNEVVSLLFQALATVPRVTDINCCTILLGYLSERERRATSEQGARRGGGTMIISSYIRTRK